MYRKGYRHFRQSRQCMKDQGDGKKKDTFGKFKQLVYLYNWSIRKLGEEGIIDPVTKEFLFMLSLSLVMEAHYSVSVKELTQLYLDFYKFIFAID